MKSKSIQLFLNDDSGATAIEYGLIVTLVAVALIVGVNAAGISLGEVFGDVLEGLKPSTT